MERGLGVVNQGRKFHFQNLPLWDPLQQRLFSPLLWVVRVGGLGVVEGGGGVGMGAQDKLAELPQTGNISNEGHNTHAKFSWQRRLPVLITAVRPTPGTVVQRKASSLLPNPPPDSLRRGHNISQRPVLVHPTGAV